MKENTTRNDGGYSPDAPGSYAAYQGMLAGPCETELKASDEIRWYFLEENGERVAHADLHLFTFVADPDCEHCDGDGCEACVGPALEVTR